MLRQIGILGALVIQVITFSSCATMTEQERSEALKRRISKETQCPESDLTIGAMQASARMREAYTWDATCKDKRFLCTRMFTSMFCIEVAETSKEEEFSKPKIMPFGDGRKIQNEE